MPAFSSRSVGYKIGLLCLFALHILVLTGFATPFWYDDESYPTVHIVNPFTDFWLTNGRSEGLWMSCDDTYGETSRKSKCHSLGIKNLAAWFHIVRLLETAGLWMIHVATVYGIVVNLCRPKPAPHSRIMEISAGLGGIVGFIGAMVYVGKQIQDDRFSSYARLSWSFYLLTVATVAVVADSILIAISNKHYDIPAATAKAGSDTVSHVNRLFRYSPS